MPTCKPDQHRWSGWARESAGITLIKRPVGWAAGPAIWLRECSACRTVQKVTL